MIKKHLSKIFYSTFIIVLLLLAAYMLQKWEMHVGFQRSQQVADFAQLTHNLRIKNLVTSVYLGPRLFDTFLEVMVVILTVFGVKTLRGRI